MIVFSAGARRVSIVGQALPPVIAQRLDESLQTQSGIANLADFGCLVGQFFPSNDPQVGKVGQGLRDATCGLATRCARTWSTPCAMATTIALALQLHI